MADWKTIPDTDVDPDAPVTSELMYALRDNPVAIAEGASGAPRVMGIALDTFLSYSDATMTQESPIAFVGLDGIGEVLVAFNALGSTAPSGTQQLQVSFTSNNGSSWSSWVNLGNYLITGSSTDGSRGCSYIFTISFNDGIACMLFGTQGASPVRSGYIVSNISGIPSNVNGFRFRQSNNSSVGYTSFACWAIGGVT